MRKEKTLLGILFFIAAMIFTSCGDEGPYNDRMALYDIVTFDGNTDSGAEFSFQRRDDMPVINLFAKGVAIKGDDVKPDTRMLIGYYPKSGEAYVSGEITLISVSPINQDELRVATADEIIGWDKEEVYLNSIWRSGKYINMYMRVDYTGQKRILCLTMDEATANDAYPQLYLKHDLLDGTGTFSRRAYISFDISSVWDNPDCKGVMIHINNSNLKTDSYTFSKQ